MKKNSPIAIVATSSILPGSNSTDISWTNILSGKNFIKEVPSSHWLPEDYYGPESDDFSRIYAKTGAFLSEIPFDPVEFNMPPNTLSSTDTNQLLALIAAKRLIKNVKSLKSEKISLKKTGIILGVAAGSEMQEQMSAKIQKPVWKKVLREQGLAENEIDDICSKIENQYPNWTENTFPGLLSNVVAGRVANKLNLGGCNFVTDAACASSLSAINMAMLELQNGNTDMVISGGVDALSNIFMYMCFTKTPALSPTGDIRPFSNAGDGTILGEGVTLFALRRLEDAERDGDDIYAVINSCGSSSDGKFKSIYAPSPEGQSRCINNTYQDLDYGLGDVELIEAHGTGTKAGDAAEFQGLRTAFENDSTVQNKSKQYCALGTIKSQIGHAKSTAGAAGLLKILFALQHKVLPPTIKIEQPNDKLNIQNSSLYLNTQARPWIKSSTKPRRASVSSFGFGGSNFHLSVEEYLGPQNSPKRIYPKIDKQEISFHLSANSAEELTQKLNSLSDQIDDSKTTLLSLARSSHIEFQQTKGFSAPIRLAIVTADKQSLLSLIEKTIKSQKIAESQDFTLGSSVFLRHQNKKVKTAILFAGQGSQYLNMGKDLLVQFEQARSPWDNSHQLKFKSNKSLNQLVYPIPVFSKEDLQLQEAELSQIEHIQPALGALSLSHLEMLKTLGLEPQTVAGHSYGELPALFAAGAITDPLDLLEISQKRAELMSKSAQSEENQKNPGAMTAVFSSGEKLEGLLEKFNDELGIANLNTPEQTVLSGSIKALNQLEAELQSIGIQYKRLNVPTAFHSKWVSGIQSEFQEFLDEKKFSKLNKTMFSNLSGEVYPTTPAKIKQELSSQLSNQVKFKSEIENISKQGVNTFIEVGPGKALSNMVKATLGSEVNTVSMDLGPKVDSVSAFWKFTAELSALGVELDLEKLWSDFAPEDAIPHKVEGSKATIMINGANFGKIYPPKEGASALPPINEKALSYSDLKTKNQELNSDLNQLNQEIKSLKTAQIELKSQIQKNTLSPTHTIANAQNNLSAGQPMTKESNTSTPSIFNPSSEWLSAIKSIQDNAFKAQQAFQDTLAQSHQNYLKSTQNVLSQLLQNDLSNSSNIQSLQNYANPIEAPLARQETKLPSQAPQSESPKVRISSAPLNQTIIEQKPTVEVAKITSAPITPNPTPPTTKSSQEDTRSEKSSQQDFVPMLLEIVSEKTGYPEEMLELDLDMESGLGIDSIKRVEILSALQDKIPELKDVDTAKLAAMNTLGEILEFANEVTGAQADVVSSSDKVSPTSTPSSENTQATDFVPMLLEIVSEKTGYPEEMLELDLDMESGLGIDSIKRVEILSALQDKIPELKDVDTAKLAAMNTLGEILEFANEVTGSTSPSTLAHSTSLAETTTPNTDYVPMLLGIVSEKTGYPEEMLELDLDMESGLGIDSIKRVEILSALQDKIPELKDVDTAKLAAMNTLGEILEFAKEVTGEPSLPKLNELPSNSNSVNSIAVPKAYRYPVFSTKKGLHSFALQGIQSPGILYVIEDSHGVSKQLHTLLNEQGIHSELISYDKALETPRTKVIYTEGLKTESIQENNFKAFRLAQNCPNLKEDQEGIFVCVHNTNYQPSYAYGSGLSALIKTAHKEWSKYGLKSIDIQFKESNDMKIEDQAQLILKELLVGGPEIEICYDAQKNRCIFESPLTDLDPQENPYNSQDLWVVSGGLKGVTADCLVEMAQISKLKLAILGRSEIIKEPQVTLGVTQDSQLKKALLGHFKDQGKKVTPADLNTELSKILSTREMESNLKRFSDAGAEVKYFSCDISNKKSVQTALEEIRLNMGEITGIVHGAGVLADKLIREKTEAQYRKVFNTKVEGFKNLLELTQADPVRLICSFSSVAARTGNVGQVDYSMANEVLNKVSQAEYNRRQALGKDCIVKSINWGPWDGGMVSEQLKKHFASQGIELLDVNAGARAFVNEVCDKTMSCVEVVIGGSMENWANKESSTQKIYPLYLKEEFQPWLNDHQIKDQVVVPAMMVNEWFLKANQALTSTLTSLRDFKVIKGIILSNFNSLGEWFNLVSTENQDHFKLELRSASNILHYSCILPKDELISQEKPSVPLFELASNSEWEIQNIYPRCLFHGPKFQVIDSLDHFSSQDASAQFIPSQNFEELNYDWSSDVSLMDGSVQLAVLWAMQQIDKDSLPTGYQSMKVYNDFSNFDQTQVYFEATLHDRAKTQGNLFISSLSGELIAKVQGLEITTAPSDLIYRKSKGFK